MKVNDQNTSVDYQKKLQRKQQNLIAAQEEEIHNLKNRFENQKREIRSQTEAQINAEHVQSKQRLLEASERAQSSLARVQKQNQLQENILKNERESLVSNATKMRANLMAQFQDDFQQRLEKSEELNRKLDQRSQIQLQKLEGEVQSHIEQNKAMGASKVYESDNRLQQRLDHEETAFNQMVERQRKTFYHQLSNEKKSQSDMLKQTQRKNKIALENEKQTQKHQLNYVRDFYKNKLAQEKESFQAKYQKQVSEHKSILQRLKEQFANEVSKFKTSSAQTKEGVVSRAQDPFYQMTLFSPKVIDHPKEVEIDLHLQEHEVDNLQINVQGKEVNLSLTRRFNEELTASDGSFNRSKRSEVISKKIDLPTYLKEKSLTKHYHDGILSIRIQKDV